MSYSFKSAYRVLHRWDTLRRPPQDRVHVTQGPGVTHKKGGEVPLASQCQPAFKQAYASLSSPLAIWRCVRYQYTMLKL
jgi:hypothetical protein